MKIAGEAQGTSDLQTLDVAPALNVKLSPAILVLSLLDLLQFLPNALFPYFHKDYFLFMLVQLGIHPKHLFSCWF